MEHFYLLLLFMRVSLIAQLVNNLLAVQETWVQFLGQEDPLEKEMATHSSILDFMDELCYINLLRT